MFRHSVFEIVQHLHFLQFEFSNPASCVLNSLLVFKYLLLSFFFELHFSEFFVEELGLFETSFLLSDDFSLLELSRKLSLSYLISFFLKLCFAFSLQFALLFKGDHLLISAFELISLLFLSSIFGEVKAFLELFLLTLLFEDPALEVTNLVSLDLL